MFIVGNIGKNQPNLYTKYIIFNNDIQIKNI